MTDLRDVAAAFCQMVEDAERAAEESGGQQVMRCGDFAYVAPSTRRELRWWAERMREALAREGWR